MLAKRSDPTKSKTNSVKCNLSNPRYLERKSNGHKRGRAIKDKRTLGLWRRGWGGRGYALSSPILKTGGGEGGGEMERKTNEGLLLIEVNAGFTKTPTSTKKKRTIYFIHRKFRVMYCTELRPQVMAGDGSRSKSLPVKGTAPHHSRNDLSWLGR